MSYDFALLCRVMEAFLPSLPDCDERLANHAKETFKKYLSLNDDRVRTAHGIWLLGPGTHHVAAWWYSVAIMPPEGRNRNKCLGHL
jgi:hypothetical protein